MYEYHGWAVLRKNFTGDAYAGINEVVPQIKAKINSIGADAGVLDLRYVNGECMVHLFGHRNHREPYGSEITDLYHFIAEKAKGSYGLLYEYDDESSDGNDNVFTVLKIARGEVTVIKDTLLSPFVGVVEDDDDYDD